MTTLRTAAQQALEAMLNFPDDISDEMFESITALKAALVEDALQKFSDVNQELEAALAEHDKNLAGFKERKANWDIRAPRSPRDLQCKLAEETQERDRQRRECEEQRLAALAEPVEPVAWRFEARHIDSAWGAAVSLKHPGPEGVYMRNVVPLYTAVPQRKPLTREEAIALWADKSDGPSNSEIVLYCRAIERAHGIKE